MLAPIAASDVATHVLYCVIDLSILHSFLVPFLRLIVYKYILQFYVFCSFILSLILLFS